VLRQEVRLQALGGSHTDPAGEERACQEGFQLHTPATIRQTGYFTLINEHLKKEKSMKKIKNDQ